MKSAETILWEFTKEHFAMNTNIHSAKKDILKAMEAYKNEPPIDKNSSLIKENKRLREALQTIVNVLIEKQFEVLNSPLRKTVVNISDITNVLNEYGIEINRKNEF